MNTTQPKSADRVIALFGDKKKDAALAIGVPYTTLASWSKAGTIPAWRHAPILAAARKAGICEDEVRDALGVPADEKAA